MLKGYVNQREARYLFVDIPESFRYMYYYNVGAERQLNYFGDVVVDSIKLPAGEYTLHGMLAGKGLLHDPFLRTVVDSLATGYKDYTDINNVLPTATQSFETLLQFLGITKHWALLRHTGEQIVEVKKRSPSR